MIKNSGFFHSVPLCSAGLCALLIAGGALAQGPSFDCSQAKGGSIEALVCGEVGLSALDRRLAEVYAQAAKTRTTPSATLKAEQRGWIKGRNDCWKSDDQRACVATEYRRRIAELQARHRLVAAIGPVSYACGGDGNTVVATYFQTEPATLIAEYNGEQSLMYQQPSASGARYAGRNDSLWEHQGEARITWGYRAPEMLCKKMPAR